MKTLLKKYRLWRCLRRVRAGKIKPVLETVANNL
jgi:hypothetical protein